MIKTLTDFGKSVKKIAGTEEQFHQEVAREKERLDPEKVLVDLKKREALLNKLINEGNRNQSISKLRKSLSATISELEKILADPDTDLLSEEKLP